MAYAAAIYLKHTIERLLNSSHDLYKEVRSLQEVLEQLDSSNIRSERVNGLDEQIRETVCEFEDVLESDPFLSQSEKTLGEEVHPLLVPQDLLQAFDSFTRKVKEMKAAYIHELRNPLPEKDIVPSRTDFDGNESEMVGLPDQFLEIKNLVTTNLSSARRMILSLVGMGGIGKTTLAKKLFQDPLILSRFNRRAFVRIGPNYQLEGVLLEILKQVNPDADEQMLTEGETILAHYRWMTRRSLMDRRYFIVLDDVWDKVIWYNLITLFPENNNGSQVLVTTSLQQLAESASGWSNYQIRFLDKKESWKLLCRKVFDEKPCPSELKEAGKKIAETCEGLPLTIVTVADILSKAKKTPEYWNEAAKKRNSVFNDAYDKVFKVLYPNYNYLPQHIKPCFLYMGVFTQNYEIPCSKLIKLWNAEGYPEPEWNHTPEYIAMKCLLELSSRNLVIVHKESSSSTIKSCSLHGAFWYLCNKEAGKNKFFHGLNSLADHSSEGIKSQRRLCIRNSVLFGIKDVYNSMASISSARSLLYTGPYHQYPVPVCFSLMLLKVLKVLAIRFYEFPVEVLKLIELRYLSLTNDGELPPSISKLRNLRWFIVSRHMSIKSHGVPSYLPMEIWDMKELKHLQIMGSDLPDPCEKSCLTNLLTLLGVSDQSCTEDVFRNIPNLQKLGIRIELAPDAVESLCFFDHISNLLELKTLKCTIVNPNIMSEVVAPPALSIFPPSLVKLTLSGFGYPWEDMSEIPTLPNLKMLKLQCYAFRGPKWEVLDEGFPWLEYLLIEDTDLVHWTVCGSNNFQMLQCLSMKHCYKLKEIPVELGGSLQKIELVDCNPVAVSCAKKLKDKWDKEYDDENSLDLIVHCSWNDVKIKS